MTTTDLKPGDIVQHPEHGYGVVLKNFPGVPTIYFAGKHGYENTTRGFTGWERVETVRPGHVQVRVDDIADNLMKAWGSLATIGDYADWDWSLAARAVKAIQAQRDQATPQAAPEQPDETPHSRPCSTHLHAHGDDCNDACPTCYPGIAGAPKLTSTTVTLPCPECGEDITDTASLGTEDEGGYFLDFANSETHTCPPAQPDEPTEFGARIVVTDDLSGKAERWCRQHDGYWANEYNGLSTWEYLCQRGTVTLGWDE